MDIFNEFYIDKKQAEEGVWVEMGDAKFLIAHVGNTIYRKRFGEELRKRKLHDPEARGYLSKMTELTLDMYAETILLGWEGVKFKGKLLEYTRLNAKEMLRIDAFFDAINRLANNRAKFQGEIEGQAEKNSSKRSVGNSKSARTSKTSTASDEKPASRRKSS